MTRRVLRLFVAVTLTALLLAPTLVAQKTVVDVVADRADAMYTCGEMATFRVALSRDGQPVSEGQMSCTLTVDGVRGVSQGTLTLANGQAEVAGTLTEPGILRATVVYVEGATRTVGLGGAVFEPERIQPATPEPEDFQAFWDGQKAQLAAVPVDPQLTERPDLSDDAMTVYKITLGNIDGSRVHGWLGVPKKGGPFPAVLTVPWAGVYPTPVSLLSWAKNGCLAMAISAHDADIDLPAEEYKALNEGRLKGYAAQGRDSRDTCYFRRVFLGCVRAIDYLTSRPDWNRKAMIVTGSSQGGGLSLVTAGLDPRVTAIASNVPALCDHWGRFVGRQSGWPQLIAGDSAEQKVTAQYYDAVNFARRIECPAIVGVGLVDTTCSASSVYAAYNALQGPKQIVVSPRMGHAQCKEYSDLLYRWIPEQAGANGG
jgi:cephalosporin-C deacetylase-like acetyl esterase